MLRVITAALLLASAVLFVPPARAFGTLGHQVVAEIASRHLTPSARAQVEQLLGDRASNAMREASTWADEIKGRPELRRTGSLHFVNVNPATCRYDAATDCRGGQCLVAALPYFADRLANAPTPAERVEALKWILHLEGDAAQPLHAYGADKGGNLLQVRFEGRGTNLHHVWDTSLLETRGLDAVRYADALDTRGLPIDATFRDDYRTTVATAEDSCRVMRQPGAYQGGEIDSRYVATYRPLLERRLRDAGLRLANLLNAILSSPPR